MNEFSPPLPSMSALRSFDAAARHQSFTHAAAELNVSQGAISRQIKEIEWIIGTPLFRRVGRSVRLTNAGKAFADDLARDLRDLSNTVSRAILAGQGDVVIRFAVLPAFGNRWLLPRLPAFSRVHPEVRLSIATRDRPFNLEQERFDLAIHFGKPDWPDADHTILCSETLIAVASPEFCERHAVTRSADLASVPLLQLETRPGAWLDWFVDHGIACNHITPALEFDQFAMIVTAAVNAMGAALLPAYLIEPEIRSGTLVQIGSISVTTDNSYYIIRPLRDENEIVSVFADWMVSCV